MAIWARLQRARVALLAAGLSYYMMVSLLPLLVLGAGLVGMVSRRNSDVAIRIVGWIGVEGHAKVLVEDSITHAERTHVASSIIGVAGLVWAALAVTGALRRAVDAVWGVDDVGWSARLRSVPWVLVAVLLALCSLIATGLAADVGVMGRLLSAAVGVVFTAAISAWFLYQIGSRVPTRRALSVATIVLAAGLEVVKNGAIFVVPRLVSRDSALYGGLGSALALLVGVLVVSWLLLISTAVAAELSAR